MPPHGVRNSQPLPAGFVQVLPATASALGRRTARAGTPSRLAVRKENLSHLTKMLAQPHVR